MVQENLPISTLVIVTTPVNSLWPCQVTCSQALGDQGVDWDVVFKVYLFDRERVSVPESRSQRGRGREELKRTPC